ncbi:CD82 antigen-like [Liolophura sinensis]|uniref:CD82 antigen-like n=1 Tax=Liolophura sinensis TaxID=3198878 RepID=UPI0031597847
METCGGKCAKYLLFLYNIIFVISGAGILGVGIWIKVNKDIEQLSKLLDVTVDGTLYTAAYVLIGIGSFVFLIGFLGCCGAATENKCLLGSYIVFLVVIFAGELAAGILAAVYRNEVVDGLGTSLNSTFSDYKPKTNTTEGNALAIAWDYVQVWFNCCGAYNYTDYRVVNFSTPSTYVPDTCCELKNNDPLNPEPKDREQCQLDAENGDSPDGNLHMEGCFTGVKDTLMSHTGIMIGVGVGIAFLQFLGIALACCVCRGGKNRKDYEH